MTRKLPLLCAGFARYRSRKLIRHPSCGRLAKLRVRLAHSSALVLVRLDHVAGRIVNANHGVLDGKRSVVRADEILTAFLELQSALLTPLNSIPRSV